MTKGTGDGTRRVKDKTSSTLCPVNHDPEEVPAMPVVFDTTGTVGDPPCEKTGIDTGSPQNAFGPT